MAEGLGGLLDFAQTPMGMGLLSAAFGGLATAGRGGPINTLGAAGLSGIAGYSAAGANALKQQKADMLRRQAQTIPTLYGQDADGNATFDWKSAAALGVDPENIAKYAQLPNAGKSKVARTMDVPGADGGKQTMQYDEYGQPVGQAINSYVAPTLVDMGGSKQFAVPTAGQTFAVSMTPGERAADARGWANVGAKQQQNSIMSETNAINKEGQRTQVVQDGAGNFMLIDKGTGAIKPAITQAGGQVQGGQLAEAAVKNQKNGEKALALIEQARKDLPKATASGLGTQIDNANRFFGVSTPSAQSAAKLSTIGGNLMMLMPRMEGPQSDADRKGYETMAGRVGDSTLPAAERAAAMDAIVEITNRYNGKAPSQPTPPASQPAPNKTIQRTGTDKTGRKVIMYTDGSMEYGN
ncbi:hypothetical protein [Pseudomonas fluorescens]|uniref:hypothetical protein n=1 Tax=Pseudomonas fluorescens TaxID=294 RepID=UPI0005FAF051|nr:hypothetical protein [Pseudomonas fluorescens]KJZ41311.1 hypothetical protein VC33_00230 [Pseudomonas fluorescens]